MKVNNNQETGILKTAKQQINGLSERLFEIVALYNLGKSLNVSLEMEKIFDKAENLMKDALKIEDFSIMLLDNAGETLTLWRADKTTHKAIKHITFKLGEGITGLVAKKGKAELIQDVSKDNRFLHYKGRRKDIGSFYSVPLKNKNDKVTGVFNIHKKETHGFKDNDIAVFNAIAAHIGQAIENSITFQKTRKLAITDELTQLYSRRYFMDALEKELSKAERNHGIFSLIIIDVDRFKSVNDTYGHLSGDKVLKKLSDILKLLTRQGDITARYGGEEFMILLPGATKSDAVNIAEKIRIEVEKYLTIERKNQSPDKITISAGVCSYPESGKTSCELISCADSYLYTAKNQGRNRVFSSFKEDGPKKDDNRNSRRFPTALKLSKSETRVPLIEVNLNNQWRMCLLDNISQSGFKCYVEFEPETDKKLQCRVLSDIETDSCDLFSARIIYKKKMRYEKYSIGVTVVDGQRKWEDFLKEVAC